MHSETLPRLKAPRDHGALLSFPPLDDAGQLLADNEQLFSACSFDFDGPSLAVLRQMARHEALAAAQRYLVEAGEPIATWPAGRLLLAGHQPELFHPGVWVKNFALEGLARRHAATPLNVVVDNDTVKTTALRVPHEMQIASIAFDRAREAPYEQREVLDEALWASLPKRVEPLTRHWPFRPLLPRLWDEVQRHASRTRLLGERLARGRRAIERAWGLAPLEVPLSRLCQTTAFAWFAVHLLRNLPRFHADYNAAVQRYRERYGLRSPNHPAPDLARDGEWLEAPMWSWRAGQHRRQRLLARLHGDSISLRSEQDGWPALSGAADSQVEQFGRLEGEGYKVRTRALTTTLFCRVLLGDLFIHGIGGGKYDEVTDALFPAFYGARPPSYLVLSATLLLPLERHSDAATQWRALKRLQRDLVWNPQRHLDGSSGAAAAALVAQKRRWLDASTASHAQRTDRYRHLRAVNEQMQPLVRSQLEEVERRRAAAEQDWAIDKLRSSREYAFCLFPEDMLRGFLTPLAA
jgi:hypothetical protein